MIDTVGGSYESAVIGDRYGLDRPPTLLSRTASVAPIVFTQLKSESTLCTRPKAVSTEDAFSIGVALRPMPAEFWIEGREAFATRASAGDTFMFDLRRNPLTELHGPFHILRFYISQSSLDELSYGEGIRGSMSFPNPPLGESDPVMHGLAMSLLDRVERGGERSSLFVDHVALAFHAHISETYGAVVGPRSWARGSLAPWQLRRALEFLLARLAADPLVTDVARECGLSVGYFTRAFRQTTGTTPHQWLIRRRIERARSMLMREDLPLAQIAVACGFNDQSHFSRVFRTMEGCSPGAWRLQNRGVVQRSAF